MTDLRQLAEHEAAHAVMRYEYGRTTAGCARRFAYVTIRPDGDTAGHLAWVTGDVPGEVPNVEYERQPAAMRRRMDHRIMVSLAGAVWDQEHDRLEAGDVTDDLRNARLMVEACRGSEATHDAMVEWLTQRTRDFLTSWWVAPRVVRLADALMDAGTLSYRDAVEVLRSPVLRGVETASGAL